MRGRFESAQICLNGHVITSGVESFREGTEDFCHQCGKRTITKCLKCGSRIKGKYTRPDMNILLDYPLPTFCIKCGKKYPWTQSKLKEAKKLIEESGTISTDEQQALKKTLKEIIEDTPKTNLAARTFKEVIRKIRPNVAETLRSILIVIATQEAKNIIWGTHSN